MRRVIQRTWLPTSLFALTVLAVELILSGHGMPPLGTITLLAVLIVPATWWRIAEPHGPVSVARGTATGVLCAALIVLAISIPTFVISALRGPGEGLGALTTAVGLVFFLFALVLMAVVGAILGALTALLERAARRSVSRHHAVLPRGPK